MFVKDLGCAMARFVALHGIALAALTFLVSAFLWDVLSTDRSLAAFDVILSHSSWHDEFFTPHVHQPILIDSPTAHYPQRKFDWDALRQGQNANFNPYIFNGMPWSAQGVGAFVTSISQLVMDVANALDWSTWLRLLLAGFFMYLLLLELGAGQAASLFAGVVWMLNLHQIVWLQFPQHLATQLWIPLLFLCNLLALKSRFRTDHVLAIIVVNVLFFTSGYTQIVLFTYIALGVFNTGYLMLRSEPRDWSAKFKAWLAVHLIHISAVVFYGVGVWAEIEFISEGLRGTQDWRVRGLELEFGLPAIVHFFASMVPPLEEVKYLFTPDYFGGIWEGRYHTPYGNLVEDGRYFGVLPIVFIVYALITLRGAPNWRISASVVVTLMMLFAWFYRDPLAIAILRLIPFADKGNFSRFITLIIFFGAILAALGVNEFLRRSARDRWRGLLISLAVLAALPALVWWRDGSLDWHKFLYPAQVVAAFLVILAVVGRGARLAGLAAVLILAADLFYATYGFNTRMDNDRIFPANNAIRFLLNDTSDYRVAVIADHHLYHPNVLSYYGLPEVEGYSTVLPVAYSRFTKVLFPGRHITLNGILVLKQANVAALRMMNVKYVLSDKQLTTEGLELVLTTNNHHIYAISKPLPRVYCPSAVIEAEGFDRSLELLQRALGKEDRPVVVAPGDYSAAPSCRVSDIRVYTNSVEFKVETSKDYIVFLPYSFNKNWHAEINGERAEAQAANAIFTAVKVPAGASSVRVYYQNGRETIGASILIAGAFGLLAWLVLSRRRIPDPATGHPLGRALFAFVAIATVSKAALSLPGVRNDRIPERAPLSAPLTVERTGTVRATRHHPSAILTDGSALVLPLDVPGGGLTRIELLAATYLKDRLDYDLRIELREQGGRRVAEAVVSGRRVHDNQWFSVDFPTVDTKAPLEVVVQAESIDSDFSVWLGDDGRPSVRAHYEWNRADRPPGQAR